MANVCGVGQVAEWFKAAVLKPHAVLGAHALEWRISNINDPRRSRKPRIKRRFAMAQRSAHENGPASDGNRERSLTTNALECEHG